MRIVTIGSKSFIGSALTKAFVDDGIKALCISRDDIDLESRNSINYLKEVVSDGDIVIAAAAKAPVRDQKELFQNVKIMNNIAEALDNIDLKLFVNVGSDAVYSDSMEPISEISEANPESLHGVMHLLRENVFGTKIRSQKKLFLRFTLVYGKDDPHNGYGPNMFVRNAIAKRPIKIFGNGEEVRDHIHISHAVGLSKRLIELNQDGIFNIVSGKPISFSEIAEKVCDMVKHDVMLEKIERAGPMPHNGYRVFSTEKLENIVGNIKQETFEKAIRSDFL